MSENNSKNRFTKKKKRKRDRKEKRKTFFLISRALVLYDSENWMSVCLQKTRIVEFS